MEFIFPIQPDMAAAVPEYQSRNLFTAGTYIANDVLKDSNIVEQLNEPVISTKLSVNQSELSDKIAHDASRKLDFDPNIYT